MQLVIYAAILFFISEFTLMIAKRSKTSGVKTKNDKKSLIIFWITIPTSISLAFFNAKYTNWDTINY